MRKEERKKEGERARNRNREKRRILNSIVWIQRENSPRKKKCKRLSNQVAIYAIRFFNHSKLNMSKHTRLNPASLSFGMGLTKLKSVCVCVKCICEWHATGVIFCLFVCYALVLHMQMQFKLF